MPTAIRAAGGLSAKLPLLGVTFRNTENPIFPLDAVVCSMKCCLRAILSLQSCSWLCSVLHDSRGHIVPFILVSRSLWERLGQPTKKKLSDNFGGFTAMRLWPAHPHLPTHSQEQAAVPTHHVSGGHAQQGTSGRGAIVSRGTQSGVQNGLCVVAAHGPLAATTSIGMNRARGAPQGVVQGVLFSPGVGGMATQAALDSKQLARDVSAAVHAPSIQVSWNRHWIQGRLAS